MFAICEYRVVSVMHEVHTEMGNSSGFQVCIITVASGSLTVSAGWGMDAQTLTFVFRLAHLKFFSFVFLLLFVSLFLQIILFSVLFSNDLLILFISDLFDYTIFFLQIYLPKSLHL